MIQPELSTKWLTCDPLNSVDAVAYQALSNRLLPIPQLLQLAAFEADADIEYVHQLRVTIRRADAAITEFAEVLGKRKSVRLRRSLKAVRAVAGHARDLDVMIERHNDDGAFVKRLRKKRLVAQKRIVRTYRDLVESGKLNKRIKKLLQSIPAVLDLDHLEAFGPWASKRLTSQFGDFFKSWPKSVDDLDSLHQFRIKSKALRYTIELVAHACPPELKDQVYPRVEQLQETLGNINDHRVALGKLDRWKRDLSSEDFSKLKRRTRKALSHATRDFFDKHDYQSRQEFKHLAFAAVGLVKSQ